MGFPVGVTDLFLPKSLLHILSFLGFVRKFICLTLNVIGLGDFLDPDMSFQLESSLISRPRSDTMLTRDLLPVIKFSNLIDPPESCAVCLYEFDADDEIRRLTNCRHIFHRSCLDRWMDHDQKTCPLCRMPFVPEHMQETFTERLGVASAISDFYGDFSSITTGL